MPGTNFDKSIYKIYRPEAIEQRLNALDKQSYVCFNVYFLENFTKLDIMLKFICIKI